MSNYSESEEGNHSEELSTNGVVVRQSQWAWIWPCVPWIVLFGLSIVFDFLTFGMLPIILVARSGLGTLNHTLLTIEFHYVT